MRDIQIRLIPFRPVIISGKSNQIELNQHRCVQARGHWSHITKMA